MAVEFAILVRLLGMDQLSPAVRAGATQMDRLGASARRASEQLKGIGRGMMATGAALAVAGGGIVKQYLDLNEAQVNLENTFNRSVEGGWVDKVLKLTEKLGQDLPGSVEDMTQLATTMRAAGGNARDMAQGGLQAAAFLQVITKIPHAEMGRMFQEMSNALGLAGGDAEFLADQLARLGAESGLSVTGVHEALKHMGGPLKALGIQGKGDVDLLMAWMGTLKKAGLEDSMIGSGIKTMMSKLAVVQQKISGGDTRGAAMAKAGLDLSKHGVDLNFFDEKGQSLGLANMIGQLDKLKSLPQETQLLAETAFFGTRGMLPALLSSVAGVNKQLAIMQGRAGLADMMKRRMESAAGMWDIAKGTGLGVLKHAGMTLDADIRGILGLVNRLLSGLDDWIQKNPKVALGILKVVLGLGTLLTVGGGAMWAIGGIGSTIAKAIPLVQVFGGSLYAAAPWLALIAGAGWLLASNWDTVGPVFEQVAGQVEDTATAIRDLVPELPGLNNGAKDQAQAWSLWADAAKALAASIQAVVTGIQSLVALGGVQKAVLLPNTDAAGRIVGAFQRGKGIKGGIMEAEAERKKIVTEGGGFWGWMDRMLKPFEKVAAKDPMGVRKAIYGGGASTVQQQPTFNIQVQAPPGANPEDHAEAVMGALRERLPEVYRMMSAHQQVATRGAF